MSEKNDEEGARKGGEERARRCKDQVGGDFLM